MKELKTPTGKLRSNSASLEYEAPSYSRREILLTMSATLMVMLLASLDQTIVGTAMPRVIADLQGLEHITWVTTSYMLASTVTVPIYGKLSDMFGRKPIFLIGVIIFLIGSALSGAAQSMMQLIIYRAIQGLGAGALMPIAMAIVGDLFSPRERGKWQGVTGGVFAFSSIVGPLVGGWLTENTSWRWVFYVNLPIGIVALLVLIFLMPWLRSSARQVSIDYTGAALLIAGTIPLMLGFSWAGSDFDWVSWQVLGLIGFALVMLVIFFVYEARLQRKGGQPIIEPGLFKNSIFSISTLITTIFGMGLFGSITFIPLFVQGVIGTSATYSGLILTPMMVTAMAGSMFAGQLVSRFGKYKLIAIIGMVFTVAGAFMLTLLNVNSTNNDVLIAMLVLGIGMGFGMSLYTLIVQNALPHKIGQATSALVFFRSIGATIALAAMGSLMNAAYQPAFRNGLSPEARQLDPKIIETFDNPNILLNPDIQQQMQAQFASLGAQGVALFNSLMDTVKVALTQGIHDVFIVSAIIMTIGLIASFFLKEIPLKGGRKRVQKETVAEQEPDVSPVAMH